jgi:hypothetical protein
MFTRMRRILSRFFNRSRTINNEPLNKMSLIVIILVDLFILTNVFTGLDDISRWPLSPVQAHPCYSEWNSYQTQTTGNKDYDITRKAVLAQTNESMYGSQQKSSVREAYIQDAKNHLGSIASTCLDYAEVRDKVNVRIQV